MSEDLVSGAAVVEVGSPDELHVLSLESHVSVLGVDVSDEKCFSAALAHQSGVGV